MSETLQISTIKRYEERIADLETDLTAVRQARDKAYADLAQARKERNEAKASINALIKAHDKRDLDKTKDHIAAMQLARGLVDQRTKERDAAHACLREVRALIEPYASSPAASPHVAPSHVNGPRKALALLDKALGETR